MSTRQFAIILVALFCCACSSVANFLSEAKTGPRSGGVYRRDNYSNSTAFFNQLREPGKKFNEKQAGLYDEFFEQIDKSYQLVYHHPESLSTDTNNYYIALVKIPSINELWTVRATLNGQTLPVAFQLRGSYQADRANYVNILLTRKQLIDAYEGPEKLILFLQIDPTKYLAGDEITKNIVFPDYYLQNVLEKTMLPKIN